MKKLLLLSAIGTIFYLMTGLVRLEGGFDQYLVIKPAPMLAITFGGGEEGQWRRTHPNQETPWFLKGQYVKLIDLDWEAGQPILADLYLYGWLANACLLIGVFVALAIKLFRLVWRKYQSERRPP